MRGTLKVLLWKHFVVRVRKFINTPVEIISPAILFIALFCLKNDFIVPGHNYNGEFNVKQTDPVLLNSVDGVKSIYYTPKTDLTSLLMNKVQNSLAYQEKYTNAEDIDVLILLTALGRKQANVFFFKPLKERTAEELYSASGFMYGDVIADNLLFLHAFSGCDTTSAPYNIAIKKPKVVPAINELELKNLSKEIELDAAFVIFQNISGTWPAKLEYTIRIKNNFHTNTYRSADGDLGPHGYYGIVYKPFMKLQWAIDSNYLELLTGNKIKQRVTLQEFPYAETNEDQTATLFANILKALCYISLTLVFVFLMARLLEERITGIQELIKMVGVSNNVLGISHVINVIPAGLVYGVVTTVLVTVSSTPIIPNTNPLLIFIMLVLHYITIIAWAFCSSYIVNSTQYTETLAVLVYVALYIPARLLEGREVPRWTLPICGLLPHVPMHWFWNEVAALQQYGMGFSITDIMNSHNAANGSVLSCYLCLIIQSCVLFGFAAYLAKVRPGPYGQALPWNFLFQKQYWSIKKLTPDGHEELEELEDITNDPEYFEPPPKDMEVGIKIVNVSKVFEKHRALSEVTLDVYKGEITVLLGHNGAGKTTLMSIITGMLKATEGNVYVEGLDTVTQKDEMQKTLGLCPQHNLFFPDLTVLEHVMFFTLLKGASYKEAKESSRALLEQLGIADKSFYKSSELSGGMKRRLQLACALAGDAKVLVLDEPTSGLDVETRRGLWDLLLSLRGSRTVLLSTHFMEEAEALGDRVAALHAGRLRCHATTMHLKRALGTGYRLSFTTIGLPNEPAITAVVTSKLPDATVKETSLNSISYNLPSKSSDKFPTLFSLLESKRSELGIDSIGVGISTLEEVFLKLCSDVTTAFSNDNVDGGNIEPTFLLMTGPRLYFRQLAVLIMRQLKYLWSKKMSFLLIQVLPSIILFIGITIVANNDFIGDDSLPENKNISLNLDVYDKMIDRRVLYKVNVDGVSLKTIEKKYPMVNFEKTSDVITTVLGMGKKDVLEYNKYLVGIELNETDAKVLYTTVVRHAAPVALNLLSNVIATQLLPYSDGQTVTVYNYPVESSYTPLISDDYKNPVSAILWTVFVVFITLTTIANAVSLPCKERVSGTRHMHVLSGCAPALHWAATLLTHALIYALVLVLPVVVACVAFERDRTFDRPDFLGAMAVLLLLGILSFLAFLYIVSFHFEERGSGMILVAIIFIFGLFTPTMKSLTDTFEDEANDFSHLVLSALSYSLAPHTLTAGAIRCAHVARKNAANLTEPLNYFSISEKAPGGYMIALLVQFIFYMAIVILTQYGVFNMLFDRALNMRYQVTLPIDVDEMVRAERAYVEKAITLPKKQIQDAMLVNDLHKKYWRIFGKPCNAVQGVSFSVKKGECFGLLGVNGAGKSSTFKMMTGIEWPTRGSLFANGHFMSRFSSDYMQSLGYCPQFSGLDGFLTGYDNLKLLLTLRGLNPADVESEVKAWIETVGLEQYARRAVSGYSGGCARRLAAAAALSRGGAVTLLDEPTAGVDVAARRRVWAALRRARPHRAVVVTSHSMDEMEALCGRIAIMAGGRVRALGEPAELRAAHAAGHAVLIKLATPAATDVTDGPSPELNRLKAALKEKFNCTLRDEHKTMLHYHIVSPLRYSELFSELESLKEEFALFEDYSLTETTLEEVFLSLAREDGPGPI